MAAKIGGIENQQDGVGAGNTRAEALEHVVRDLLVLRARGQAIESGEVDELSMLSVFELDAAGALLDGYAGEVGDFLVQAGEPVEERRFAGIGRADDGDDRVSGAFRRQCRCRRARRAAVVAIAHFVVRNFRQAAVSRRSANSEPSTWYTRGS